MKRGLWSAVLAVFLTGTTLLTSTPVQGNGYQEPGWRIAHPSGWVTDGNSVKDPSSGKAVFFSVKETTKQEVENWVAAETKKSTLIQPVSNQEKAGLEQYRYTFAKAEGKQFVGPVTIEQVGVLAKSVPVYLEGRPVEVRVAVFFDGLKAYTFTSQGQVSQGEFELIIDSFEVTPVNKDLDPSQVTEISISAPGAQSKVLTSRDSKQFIKEFVAAYNTAEPYRQDVGKAYPVVITLKLKNKTQIEISGGAFDFQTVRLKDQEYNVQGAALRTYFTEN